MPFPPLKLFFSGFFVAFGGSFHLGYQCSVINPTEEIFQNLINNSAQSHYGQSLDGTQMSVLWSFLTAELFLGCIFGTLAIPFCSDRFGRKWSIFGSGVVLVLAAIPSALAKYSNSLELFFLGRFLYGIGSGFSSGIQGVYLAEISPKEHRGFIGSFTGIMQEIAFGTGALLGVPSFFGTEERWPYLYWIVIFPTLTMFVALLFLPESPNFLLNRGKKTEAKQAIGTFITESSKNDRVKERTIRKALKELERDLKVETKVLSVWETLKSPECRPGLILGVIVNISGPASGTIPAAFFGTQILRLAGLSESTAAYADVGICFATVPAVLFVTPLFDRLGRRPILLGSLSILTLCNLFLIVFIHYSIQPWAVWAVLVTCILSMIMYGSGLSGPIWFITVELVPQNAKAAAQTIAMTIQYLFIIVFTIVFYPLKVQFNEYSFVIFLVPITFFTLFLFFKLPETKNKSITQILVEMGVEKAKLVQEKDNKNIRNKMLHNF